MNTAWKEETLPSGEVIELRQEGWGITPYLDELEAAEAQYGGSFASWPTGAIDIVTRAAAFATGYRKSQKEHHGR